MGDKDYKLLRVKQVYDRMWKRAKYFLDDKKYDSAMGMYFAITIMEDMFPEVLEDGRDDVNKEVA